MELDITEALRYLGAGNAPPETLRQDMEPRGTGAPALFPRGMGLRPSAAVRLETPCTAKDCAEVPKNIAEILRIAQGFP